MDEIKLDQSNILKLLSNLTQGELLSLKNNYDPDNRYASGRWDLGHYQHQSAMFSIKDLHIVEGFCSSTNLSNMITIEVILEGGVDTLFNHAELKNNDMPRILFSSHAQNNHQFRRHLPGTRYKALALWIRPNVLIQKFDLDCNTFPKLTAELLEGKHNRTLALPITSAIKHCTEDIFACAITSRLEQQYLEAKITELLYFLITALYSPDEAFNLSNRLSSRKSAAMKKVLELINHKQDDDVCIASLAQEVNMSVSSLSKTFKNSYGMNISKYRQQQRLIRAFDMVLAGKLSILQIALEIGYKDQSSFTRAFKEYFGYTPSDLKYQ